MSDDEPRIFTDRLHAMCQCGRVLKSHCEAFKYKLFWNCRNEDVEEKKNEE